MRFSLLFICAMATSLAAAQNNTAAIGTNCAITRNITVKSGDNLAAIGTSTNTTLSQLLFVNPQISNPRNINPGDIIQIPSSTCVAPAAAPLAEPTATCSNGTASTITVVAGDTGNIIAKEKLGITLGALVAANPQVKDINKLEVGQVLNVPLCGKVGGGGGVGNGTAASGTAKETASATKKGGAKATGAGGKMRRRGGYIL
ncbi:hypothetical protein B0J14DRAFT_662162 [Halenospora varia]|nr:hypothetical protein B0J14DRAFT_662162 [Halenospora varia]